MSASGVVGPGEGQLHWLGGISARTLVTGAASGGRFAVVTAGPGALVRTPRDQRHTFLPGLVARFGLAQPPEMGG